MWTLVSLRVPLTSSPSLSRTGVGDVGPRTSRGGTVEPCRRRPILARQRQGGTSSGVGVGTYSVGGCYSLCTLELECWLEVIFFPP